MDDLIFSCKNLSEIHYMKSVLDDKFNIKDLGDLKYFLGLEISRSSQDISLCQGRYSLDLLHDTRLLTSKISFNSNETQLQLKHWS